MNKTMFHSFHLEKHAKPWLGMVVPDFETTQIWSFIVRIGGTKIHLPDEKISWKFSEYANVIINVKQHLTHPHNIIVNRIRYPQIHQKWI